MPNPDFDAGEGDNDEEQADYVTCCSTTLCYGEIDLVLRRATLDAYGCRTWMELVDMNEGEFILGRDLVVWVPKLLDNMQRGSLF